MESKNGRVQKRGRRSSWATYGLTCGAGVFIVLAFAPIAGATVATSDQSIGAGFNGQSIPAGDTVWFQAVLQWVGPGPSIVTHVHLYPVNITISEPDGVVFVENIPGAEVTYDPSATSASTVWNATLSEWITTVPASYGGDVFASGYPFHVPSGGLQAGTHVRWDVNFHSSEGCLSFNWKFAAAVYTHFAAWGEYGSIGVKPVDSPSLSSYANSDHAGTPEAYKAYLTAGAMGGGGSNFTGSYSGTGGVRGGTCPGTSH